MNMFQIIVLPILGVLFLGSMLSGLRPATPRRVALFWAFVWLAAGVGVAWPDVTRAIARPLGINRGADLVFYCAILIMFAGFYTVYVRLRRQDACITKLVRYLAIENAATPQRDTRVGADEEEQEC